jgi:hypothetical protein
VPARLEFPNQDPIPAQAGDTRVLLIIITALTAVATLVISAAISSSLFAQRESGQ